MHRFGEVRWVVGRGACRIRGVLSGLEELCRRLRLPAAMHELQCAAGAGRLGHLCLESNS